MDAQHQKTNKSAQFACYLREHTSSSSSITSYIYLFALLFPPSSICSSYTAHSSRTTGQASKQASNKERAKVFGDDLFFFFLFFGHGDKRLRQELPTLPYLLRYKPANREPPNRELRLRNQTTMCDYTKVEYACYHLRYTVRAWCVKYQETHKRCPANVVAVEYRLDERCGDCRDSPAPMYTLKKKASKLPNYKKDNGLSSSSSSSKLQ